MLYFMSLADGKSLGIQSRVLQVLGWPLFHLPGFSKMSLPLELLHCVLGFFLFRYIKSTGAAKKTRVVFVILKTSIALEDRDE